MPETFADLRIDAAYIAPMNVRETLFKQHSLVVRDGRILDILPTAHAKTTYRAAATVERGAHLLMPGMINAHAQAELSLIRANASGAEQSVSSKLAQDGTLRALPAMLESGITCFADRCQFPDAVARAARNLGMRAMIGMPIAAETSPWASSAAEYFSRALELRDEFRGHPLISTCFAPRDVNSLSSSLFERLATLADELDAGIAMQVLLSRQEIERCHAEHGVAPLQRLAQLRLLTPAFNALHMTQATATDLDLAQRTGLSVTLCPQMNLKVVGSLPPVQAMAGAQLRMNIGTASGVGLNYDVWTDMRVAALAGQMDAWDALALVTRQAAAGLGWDAEIGTLEPGKWADVCCMEIGTATDEPQELLNPLVFWGGRESVTDVWVAGRQLLSERALLQAA
jgi:5-methylthioadenosine/S-adenosylhomocysteine deaminase